jgi:serine phosphatase RsbU (regulator of sigma subunit)
MPTDGGLPFGVPFSNELAPAPLQLVRGDRLILYSDGVVEARPPSGEAFGLDAFVELLIASRASSPREATRRVVHDVRAHRDAELEDDATIVVIDVLGHR